MGRTVNEHAALLTHTCIERTPIMKLNPFTKKAPSYLAGVKADYQRLQLELSTKESALQTAREDLSAYLQDLANEEARFPNRHFRSETESALNRQADAARVLIGTLEYAVRDLQREINKLSAIVNAADITRKNGAPKKVGPFEALTRAVELVVGALESANMRILAIWLACLFGDPRLFWWFELGPLTLVAVIGITLGEPAFFHFFCQP